MGNYYRTENGVYFLNTVKYEKMAYAIEQAARQACLKTEEKLINEKTLFLGDNLRVPPKKEIKFQAREIACTDPKNPGNCLTLAFAIRPQIRALFVTSKDNMKDGKVKELLDNICDKLYEKSDRPGISQANRP